MELLCLVGAALSLAATLVEALRDSVVFFCLWALYLSMYQVSLQYRLWLVFNHGLLRLLSWCVLYHRPFFLLLVSGGPSISLLPVVSNNLIIFAINITVLWIAAGLRIPSVLICLCHPQSAVCNIIVIFLPAAVQQLCKHHSVSCFTLSCLSVHPFICFLSFSQLFTCPGTTCFWRQDSSVSWLLRWR